ncbi:DUF5675 family protein [Cecembia lonarensis]|uniref:DUF5675 domain-containing protein n=1 Tax=Cecembia lonarensis (strain CCUG 58316 / KCTC 22772 / LW9) TaxID=1225176 RepID=K1L967_CECL9|nr:DUF5675 family protein [Cecembia lonarensis]EKB48702.1 hypothetical protein B879_02661 [Cecembia lonarensis LW9]
MKLLLLRRYGKKETRGILYRDNRPLCRTLEPPAAKLAQLPCLPEGEYLLQLAYSESKGWYLVLHCPGRAIKGRIFPLFQGHHFRNLCISPVTAYRENGRFSKLAFLKLMDKIEAWTAEGEEISIEIRSLQTQTIPKPWSSQKVLSA